MVALLVASTAQAADFSVEKASVSPPKAFLSARGGVRIEFRIAAAAPAEVSIRIVGARHEVRRIDLVDVPPGTERIETWDGLTNAGTPAPDGSYRVLIGPPGGEAKQVGKLTLFGHFFPVRGPHGTRDPVGEFGAARNGGRVHKGFDVTARCGTPLQARTPRYTAPMTARPSSLRAKRVERPGCTRRRRPRLSRRWFAAEVMITVGHPNRFCFGVCITGAGEGCCHGGV